MSRDIFNQILDEDPYLEIVCMHLSAKINAWPLKREGIDRAWFSYVCSATHCTSLSCMYPFVKQCLIEETERKKSAVRRSNYESTTDTFWKYFEISFQYQATLSCWFGLLVWVFLITLFFDQRKTQKLWSAWKTINEKISKEEQKHWLQIDRRKHDLTTYDNFEIVVLEKCHENAMNLPWK